MIWPKGGHGTDGLVRGACRVSIQSEFLRTADPAAVPVGCVATGAVRPLVVP